MGAPTLEVDYVRPAKASGGVDPLGVQTIGVGVYTQLLPGITNVTNRAFYYVFHPWLFSAFERRGWRSAALVRERLRRAEVLLLLIAVHHGARAGGVDREHSPAVVGINRVWNAYPGMVRAGAVRLSDFAHRRADATRYFKAPEGGLGQYYFGSLWQLGLLDGERASKAFATDGVGTHFAARIDAALPADAFLDALEADRVSIATLEALAGFCPCCLQHPGALREDLLALFTEGFEAIAPGAVGAAARERDTDVAARAESLALIQWLISVRGWGRAGSDGAFLAERFRALVYTLHDDAGSPLALPAGLIDCARRWQVYQRHELLSCALQALFHGALRWLECCRAEQRFASGQAAADAFFETGPGSAALAETPGAHPGAWLAARASTLPGYADWGHPGHEHQRLRAAVAASARGGLDGPGIQALTSDALTLLAALLVREDNADRYGAVGFRAGFFEDYPLTLERVHTLLLTHHRDATPAQAFAALLRDCCLEAHQRVALGKLRFQGTDTFCVLETEGGLAVQGVPAIAETTPRLANALRILRDLALLRRADDGALEACGEPLWERYL
ncbi:hypothetical protein J2T57_001525 [Natronocella acetinitrilica]|uniref:Uncharacterized protein n=2 Tax=Natronocella acetinitrilica TaxID=414046 RepID=A0AAE3G3C5_9GAMM|nr:hypothetical protein [Natronocella acetinitrilica]